MTEPRANPPRHAVPLLGLAVAAVGLTTTIPLPLYVSYAARGGHGAGALAAAFACYAATLIVTAPLLGPLSDRIGRRPCLLLGLVLASLSTLLLCLAPGVPALAVARVFQGLAMGCTTSAAAAWAAELGGGTPEAGRRAAVVVTTGTAGSFGLGGVLTLLCMLAQPGQEPPLTYPFHLLAVAALLWPVARLPETLAQPGGAWLRLPIFPRGTLLTTLAILPAWGISGTTLTSIPQALAARGMPLAGPVSVCVMMLVGVASQQLIRRVPPRLSVQWGLVLLCTAGGLTLWGAATGRLLPLLGGGVVLGCAVYGLIYLGGLAAVAEVPGPERARAAAGYFVVAHVGFSAVPLLVGLAVDGFGTGPALGGLWVFVTLCALALVPAIGRR